MPPQIDCDGFVPVTMRSASLDVERFAFAMRMFISLCTLTYFRLLYSYFVASIQIGAPYNKRDNIAPLYIVFSASCLSRHGILADISKLSISLAHLFAA